MSVCLTFFPGPRSFHLPSNLCFRTEYFSGIPKGRTKWALGSRVPNVVKNSRLFRVMVAPQPPAAPWDRHRCCRAAAQGSSGDADGVPPPCKAPGEFLEGVLFGAYLILVSDDGLIDALSLLPGA